jgi:DDE superfamily endonuclease
MKRSGKIRICHRGAPMLSYPAALRLSHLTLTCTAGVIRRHRRQIGSPWRKVNPDRQALLVLAYLPEIVALLAARSPKLHQVLAAAKKAGHAYVVIDGTLIPIDRVAADRPFYSGKHRRHDMNLQVTASPDGEIVWVSGPLPGAAHDLSAARIWGIVRELAACGLIVLADKGYAGTGEHIHVPYRGRGKPASQKDANRAQLRSPGERANAQLKTWRILRRLRCCPWRAGQLSKAIHVLQAREIAG